MEPPLKKQQTGNSEHKAQSKDKGKSVVCKKESDPDARDNGNRVVPSIDHHPQLANSSHIGTGIPAYQPN